MVVITSFFVCSEAVQSVHSLRNRSKPSSLVDESIPNSILRTPHCDQIFCLSSFAQKFSWARFLPLLKNGLRDLSITLFIRYLWIGGFGICSNFVVFFIVAWSLLMHDVIMTGSHFVIVTFIVPKMIPVALCSCTSTRDVCFLAAQTKWANKAYCRWSLSAETPHVVPANLFIRSTRVLTLSAVLVICALKVRDRSGLIPK